MKNPKELSEHREKIFRDGVVVFKKQIKRRNFVVVTEHPFPKVNSKKDLPDNKVMAVEMDERDYQNLKIGTIVVATGYLESVKRKDKWFYYVNAKRVVAHGQQSIKDPDFHKLIDIISQREKDDDSSLLMISCFILLYPTLF